MNCNNHTGIVVIIVCIIIIILYFIVKVILNFVTIVYDVVIPHMLL